MQAMIICGRYLKYLPSLIKLVYEVIKLYKKLNHKPTPVKIEPVVAQAKKTRDTSELEKML